jgi:Domain of unknown function (DUF4124)
MLIFGFPYVSLAQAYKRKQANGTVNFQDQPCAEGANASSISLAPVPSAKESSEAHRALQEKIAASQAAERQRAEADSLKRVEERLSSSKAKRCEHARQQLDIAKDLSSIVYRKDKEGNPLFCKIRIELPRSRRLRSKSSWSVDKHCTVSRNQRNGYPD